MTRLRWLLMEAKDVIHGMLLVSIFMACFAAALSLSKAYLLLSLACTVAVGLGWAVLSNLQVKEAPDRLTNRHGQEIQ